VLASGLTPTALGSFSGERPGSADAETTCRLKGRSGNGRNRAGSGLAAKGSFGPPPALPFLPWANGMDWPAVPGPRPGESNRAAGSAVRTNFDALPTGQFPRDLDPWLERGSASLTHAVIVQPHRARAKNPALSKGPRRRGRTAGRGDRAGQRACQRWAWPAGTACAPTKIPPGMALDPGAGLASWWPPDRHPAQPAGPRAWGKGRTCCWRCPVTGCGTAQTWCERALRLRGVCSAVRERPARRWAHQGRSAVPARFCNP